MKTVGRASVSLHVDPEVHERLVERARPEERSVSAALRVAIREYLRKPGVQRDATEEAHELERQTRTHTEPGGFARVGRGARGDGEEAASLCREGAANAPLGRAVQQVLDEIENDLVPCLGGRWMVSASNDRIYTSVRGTVFAPHSVNAIADRTELAFYVDHDGELHFFEQLPGTWTEHLEKKAARELAEAARKPLKRAEQ